MRVEELEAALHATPAGPTPDLDAIRARGRRRRWARRAATGGVVAGSVLGVAAAASLLLGPGAGTGRAELPPASTPGERVISTYEQRVLDEVDDAYAVGGTVIVPGPVTDPGDGYLRIFSEDQLAPHVVPLGFHAFTGVGYMSPGSEYPRWMVADPPPDTQVTTDNGPVSLGCVRNPGRGGCGIAVLSRLDGGRWAYVYGLGSDSFLEPRAEMEVFLDNTYVDRRREQSVIGGFDGTAATRVVLTLVDGSHVDAGLDSGHVSAGDTLFWGQVAQPVAHVTAYDASGDVVAEHTVRACSGGVDCEVR